MQRIRSIQVINVRWFNATAWYGLFLSKLLREAGHEVLVLGLPGTDSFRKAEEWGLQPLGLDLNSANPLNIARLYRQLGKIVDDFKPDIVNCHRGEAFLLWGLLKRAGRNFRLVRTRGDQRPPKGNLPNRILHNQVADAVIATNSRTRDSLIKLLRLPPEKVSLVRGGVDTRVFFPDAAGRAAVRAEYGYGPEDFVLGLVGRFDGVKGHDVLFEALRLLRADKEFAAEAAGPAKSTGPAESAGRAEAAGPVEADGPAGQAGWGRNLRLFLIGFGTTISEEEILNMAASAGVAEITRISGKRPDINACLNALDLGILASTGSEAIARAAVELMACGVPLLSTNVGIMPDLLPQNLLVPPSDPQALAENIKKALLESAYLQTLRHAGQACLQGIKESDFLVETLAVYNRCLKG